MGLILVIIVFRNGLLAEQPEQLLLEEMVKGLIQINSITQVFMLMQAIYL
jgi:hypothetical protein